MNLSSAVPPPARCLALVAAGLLLTACRADSPPKAAPGSPPAAASAESGGDPGGMGAIRLWKVPTREPGEGQRSLLGAPTLPDVASEGAPPAGWPSFRDVALERGLRFTRVSGASGRKHYCEPKGGGVAVFDADGDGWDDVYLVDGGVLPGYTKAYERSNRLFRNVNGERFEDITERAGVAGVWYGMGAAAADYDGDGDTDLLVTGVARTVLFRNRGDGTFEDVTDAAGARVSGWTTSPLFVDLDEDGDLDVYIARYLDYHPRHNPPCYSSGVHNYCTPHDFKPLSDVVLINDGKGRFTDGSQQITDAPLDGMGLMVASSDLDGDGHVDLYVANDEVPNFLLLGEGKGRFREEALLAGVAVGPSGLAEAGMGVDIGDIDGDRLLDIVVANFAAQPVDVYRNLGGAVFAEESARSGVFGPTFRPLNFGLRLFDADNDGDLDLYVCNGHIWDTIATFQPGQTFPQQNTLLRNQGAGRYEDLSSRSGPGLLLRRPSRGLAAADFDHDGDVDLVYSNQDAPVVLLRNDGGNAAPWLQLKLRGRSPNTDAIGARVELHQGEHVQLREVTAGGGYQSSSAPTLHFGLGKGGPPTRIVVRWPPPSRQTTEHTGLKPGRLHLIRQPAR